MTDKEIIEQQRTMIAMLQESYQQLKNKDSNGFDRNITFRDCAEAYLKYLKRNSKASSYDNVKWMFDKVILNELGGILIADMKRSTIQSLADKLAEHYSPHTVQDFIALIKTTLKYASKNEMIPSVTYSIDLPKKERQN